MVHGDENLAELLRRFSEVHENQLIVVDAQARPAGVIDLRDVVEYSGDAASGQILVAWDMARFVEPLSVAAPLSEAMERVWRLDSALLPVVDPARAGRLVGALARKDLLNAFDREMLRKRLLLTRFLVSRGGPEPLAEGGRQDDYVLVERDVPEHFCGKSLADLDLPANRHMLVVALRRGDGKDVEELMPPPAGLPLAKGDRLVLLGHRKDLDELTL
jgi:CBS domain-containing protein